MQQKLFGPTGSFFVLNFAQSIEKFQGKNDSDGNELKGRGSNPGLATISSDSTDWCFFLF